MDVGRERGRRGKRWREESAKKSYLVYTQYSLMQMTMRIRCNRTCAYLSV